MMRYEEGELADQRPCAGVRADLKMCLLESDCCKKVSNLFLLECINTKMSIRTCRVLIIYVVGKKDS